MTRCTFEGCGRVPMAEHCSFCHGQPVSNAASWLDGEPRPPAPCPRCGKVATIEVLLVGMNRQHRPNDFITRHRLIGTRTACRIDVAPDSVVPDDSPARSWPVHPCSTCWPTQLHQANNPVAGPEKGEPMEASSTATNTTSGNGAGAEPEKEKRDPTRYHVLKLLTEKGEKSQPHYERLTEKAIAASSTTQAIELALADGHGNGTYVAVPERSFQEKSVKVEEVKTQKVVVG